jgi:Domain of unknown function (DUF1707)
MTAAADTDPQAPSRNRVRCSDAQRLAVVHRLQDAVGHGLLTLEECTERTDATYRARYVDELPALTDDLPEPLPAAPLAPGWRAVASSAALQARMSLLGAPTWADADARRRRIVVLTGILVTLLLIATITAAAASGATDPTVHNVPPGDFFEHHPHYWDH